MPLLPEHPRRHDVAQRIATLDAHRDAETIYRLSSLYELPWEMRFGLNLAFYRTFAAPRIAAVIAASGQMERDTRKRATDTGLFMYELIEHGYDHPRGRDVVRGLNRVHKGHGILNEDYLYVLAAFVVVPTRWIDEYGWRRLTPHEREAAVEFYRRLGRRMNLTDVPDTYEEFAELLDTYEAEHLAPSPAGRRQMEATTWVVAEALPSPIRRLAPLLTTALADDELCQALGLTPAPRPVKVAARRLLRARGAVVRRMPARTSSWFTDRPRGARIYPHGYDIDDLGPRTTHSTQ